MFNESNEHITSNNLIKAFLKFRRMGISKGGKGLPESTLPNGLRHSEVMMLFAIKEMERDCPEGISVSDLSSHLCVKPPTITPMISNLENKNMLERSMDPNDRRIVRIKLKEGGNKFIETGSQHFITYIQGLVDYLGDEKSNTLADLMNEVYDYFIQTPHHKI
jgi:DNA-binding MarR family transcriptional regulator